MNRFDRPPSPETIKHPSDMLKGMLDSQARRVNEALERENFPDGLLNHDATLDPNGYAELYGKEAVKADEDFVREREIEFSAARNPKVQAFYREKHGARSEDEIISRWRENKSREKNGQMEMAVTALLSQKLGSDFLVVRTAPYDDYKNGVDNLILDRITGDVIGAFDEVHEGGGGDRTEKKKKKIQEIASRGGAKIRYGLKLEDGKLARAKLEGVPVFYLGLDSSELTELMQGLNGNDPRRTDKIFEKLLASLETQRAELEKSANSPGFRKRLLSFGQSLSRLRDTQEVKAA